MDAYRTINDTLVNLFNEIWELEKRSQPKNLKILQIMICIS